MNLQRLRILRAVIEEGTHDAAAERLFISQPAVSAHIKKLSQELEVKLFEKVGRQLEPTEAGQVLYQYACRTLNLVRETKDVMNQFQEGTAGTVRLGVDHAAAAHLLPNLMHRLEAYDSYCPDVKLSIDVGAPMHLEEQVRAHEADLAVVGTEHGIGGDLESRELFRDRMVVAAKASHPLAQRSGISPELLSQYHFVMQRQQSGTREWALAWLRHLGADPVVCLTLTELERVVDTVSSFHLLSVVPFHAVSDRCQRGELVTLPVADEPGHRPLYLVHRQDKVMSPLLEQFEAKLQETAAELKRRQEPDPDRSRAS